MERLTERFSNGQAAVYGCGNNCKYDYKYCNNHLEDCPTINEIYEKLAAYEDLEEKLEETYGQCDGLLETVVNSLVRHEGVEIGTPQKARLLTDEDVDKWQLFKNEEEKRLLRRVPCNIGDIVYEASEYYGQVIPRKVSEIIISENNICIRNGIGDYFHFGVDVFLTYKEALSALMKIKEMGNK